jgi:demethylmenaquinone methyltransferase/2-methoxy-6-polyprenyl-1,4-benzoquinol methylase
MMWHMAMSESAAAFPYGALNNILRKIGFIDVIALPQTFGVALLHLSEI